MDVSLYYSRYGAGAPVIMLPGLSLDADIYLEVVPHLGQGLEAVLVDNRGAGRSDSPREAYRIESMAADVSSLILGMGLDKAVVVGHSMGGFVALSLALQSPELVSGLVLVGTAAMGRVKDLGTGVRARAALDMRAGSLADIVRANIEAGVAPAFLRDHSEKISRFVHGRVALPPRGRGVEGQRRAAGLFDVRERLWEISCPVLVCHGQDDEVVPLVRGQELACSIRDARLFVWPGVGHYPCLESPDSLGRAIRDFCADV